LLPNERLEIEIEVTGETERRISIRGASPRMEAIVTRLAAACGSI
jgi:hypothetical protein